MKEKICIWGTGKASKKLYYLLKDKYEIVGFFDNNPDLDGTTFMGKTVQRWKQGDNYCKLVIASSFWEEIASQLVEQGLIPIKDFLLPEMLISEYGILEYKMLNKLRCVCKELPYSFLCNKKKIAVVYGNCQTEVITKILSLHSKFTDEYMLINIPRVCDYVIQRDLIEDFVKDDEFWKHVSLFVYQYVDERNKFANFLSTEFLIKKLSSTCKKINIVNMFFSGYFPQVIRSENRIGKELHQSGIIHFKDRYIDELIECGISVDEIIYRITNNTFLDEKTILDMSVDSLAQLILREKKTDVKISDYIRKFYRDKQLFYSQNHPTEGLMLEYVNRILKFMNFEPLDLCDVDICLYCGSLKGQDVPLYPAVVKALGLKNFEKKYYPNRYIYSNMLLDFEQYIRLYIDVNK